MKVVFYYAEGKSREGPLKEAFQHACRRYRDDLVWLPNSAETPAPADVAVMVGMKSTALRLACLAAGQRVLTFDKGYDRKDDWWRVSIDTHQPTRYLNQLRRPMDRYMEAGWNFAPWRASGSGQHVIIAGGGLKYHKVHRLPDPTDYARELARQVRDMGWSGEIFYRPKPSMPDIVPVEGTTLSRHKYIGQVLAGAHALVTFGSNACFEAMLAGVPSIVLGDAVMRPISSTQIESIMHPRLAEDGERARLLHTLAYCQFREREISKGKAWDEIKLQLREVLPEIPQG
jgi:hypothetical protein